MVDIRATATANESTLQTQLKTEKASMTTRHLSAEMMAKASSENAVVRFGKSAGRNTEYALFTATPNPNPSPSRCPRPSPKPSSSQNPEICPNPTPTLALATRYALFTLKKTMLNLPGCASGRHGCVAIRVKAEQGVGAVKAKVK